MTEPEDYCDPGAGVFTPGCTQHLPSGESTSAKLRHAEQEMDVVRGSLTELAALYDSATAETARVAQERDQLAESVSRWQREFHLADADLVTARAEMGRHREDMRIKALMVANLNHRLMLAGRELERLQPIADAARAYVTYPDSGDPEAERRYRALSELFYPEEQGEDHARNR